MDKNLRLRSASDDNVSDIKESMNYRSIEIGTESCRVRYGKSNFLEYTGCNRRFRNSKEAVDSAIKSAKLNNEKLYAINVISPREISRTQHNSRDTEWEIRKLCRSVEACKVTQHDSEILNGKGK